jgi:hypothetical protein
VVFLPDDVRTVAVHTRGDKRRGRSAAVEVDVTSVCVGPHDEAAYVADPDGNVLVLARPIAE